MRIFFLTLFIRFLFPTIVFSQTTYPLNYFVSPIHSEIHLAGNFGEIRSNHFHSGFDIQTNGMVGMPIYAVADGFVSRIRVSATGYGTVLYITHPNGYTSVCGHLKCYNETIAGFAKNIQYKFQSFEIDTLLSSVFLPIKKGDFIALSGNSGGSEGPHLHFEIRDSKTETPINPYFFGYTVVDDVKPNIKQVMVYPMNQKSTVNGKNQPRKLIPIPNKGNYFLNESDSIVVNGSIGFGIEAFDRETGSTNVNGVFSIELQMGGKRIYYYELEKFSFENSRYVNAHIDYSEKQKHNSKIQKCFLSKNNKIEIYKNVVNNGIIDFTDNATHWVKIIVKDIVGNSSELTLKIKSNNFPIIKNTKNEEATIFDCFKDNEYKDDAIQIVIPAYALYDDLKLDVKKMPQQKGTNSMLFQIQNDETALQNFMIVKIKALNLSEQLQNKTIIISKNSQGKKHYEGGNYENGWVVCKTKVFGNFAIYVDTIAPKIVPVFKYIPNSILDFSKLNSIKLKATDNFSEIKKYNAMIDEKWVLCEFDAKNDLLYYTFDEHIRKGKHTFIIEVSDDKNNTSTLKFQFVR